MISQYNAIRELYAFSDGDCITPSMGVSIDSGYSLAQYWDTTLGKIINTDFTKHNAKIYPQAYSSLEGKIVVPESGKWYIGSPSGTELVFNSSGVCTTSGYTDKFKVSTIQVNSQTFPCLVVCGNLATASDLNTKHIYYVGQYDGRDFTCHQDILIQVAMADAYDIIISSVGNAGEGETSNGDNVISNLTDWIRLTPYLIRGGAQVGGATYSWEKLINGTWTKITTETGVLEISGNGVLTIYEKGVNGLEYFRVTAKLGTTTVRKVIDITDVQDPFYILDGCSASSGVRSGETVTFDPKVYNRTTNEVDTTKTWKFSFTVANSKTGDVVLNANNTLRFTYDDMKTWGGRIRVQTRAYTEDEV